MNAYLLYQISLTQIPNIGAVQARILIEYFGEAAAVFNAPCKELQNIEGIGEIRARMIKRFHDFSRAEKELKFLQNKNIRPLFITDEEYPRRLLNCYDAPLLLFLEGNANLNASRMISVVGSRHHSDYGKSCTERLISDLASYEISVVSGLAYGIDAIAHKTALKYGLPTIAVLAHGLDQIYPPEHQLMSREFTNNGGLLTEFLSETNPDRHNFPTRNRIVAGITDATIVIETGVKGGSMITAELANGYNRDVFAYPGKTTDMKSAGCNQLIRNNKAYLITNANELLEMMGWKDPGKKSLTMQRELFIDLSENEKVIFDILNGKTAVHIDEIYLKSNMSSSNVASTILSMELKNILTVLPGKMYGLL